jgi:hypothetical protein
MMFCLANLLFGEPTFADAILDHLTHNAFRLALARTRWARAEHGEQISDYGERGVD